MLICGVKVTHDGSVALVDEGKLVFSIESEKRDNNARYSEIDDLQVVERLIGEFGYRVDDVDCFVLDGWDESPLARRNGADAVTVDVAPYTRGKTGGPILERYLYQGLRIGGHERDYSSYMHVAGHVAGAYCASPFASRDDSAYVLAWDGGLYPELYYYDARARRMEYLETLFPIKGSVYHTFPQFFERFRPRKTDADGGRYKLSVPGKVMAYVALGRTDRRLLAGFREHVGKSLGDEELSVKKTIDFIQRLSSMGYADADILAGLQETLGEVLTDSLKRAVARHHKESVNLCFVGGCALNILWNSRIRSSGLFEEVWIPPFTNDAGSAIGAACCEMMHQAGSTILEWDVYRGPPILDNAPGDGWTASACSIKDLARFLAVTGEPVVFLNGRAELGPRALGNRSILAPASGERMKDVLNRIKGREDYRPVAPICLEEFAPDLFDPGTPDPYMLYVHQIRASWRERIPAVRHCDGTARLQTVNRSQNRVVFDLLSEYRRHTGIPVLCNTSANRKGRGFFPDVHSAGGWGKVNYVWCGDTLYEKVEKNDFA